MTFNKDGIEYCNDCGIIMVFGNCSSTTCKRYNKKNKYDVDVWYGTPFPSKVHMVVLDKENPAFANLVCNGKRLKYQGLSAGVGFEELTCQKCLKKLESGNYQHVDEDLR